MVKSDKSFCSDWISFTNSPFLISSKFPAPHPPPSLRLFRPPRLFDFTCSTPLPFPSHLLGLPRLFGTQDFCEIFKNIYFEEHLRTAASEDAVIQLRL